MISKPDKQLWPDAGDGEAGHQARSRAVFRSGGRMDDRRILKGRPAPSCARPMASMARSFFQRHAHAGHIEPVIDGAQVSGDRKPYVQIDRVEALAPVAQIGGARTASVELFARCSRHPRAAGVRPRPRAQRRSSIDVIEAARRTCASGSKISAS